MIQVSVRVFVAILLLFACTPDERDAFEPCGQNEAWWIDFSPEAQQTLAADNIRGWGQWPVRVRGTLSPEGHYGHLGSYSRQLHVERVIATGRRAPC